MSTSTTIHHSKPLRSSPQLIDLQRFFLSQLCLTEQKHAPVPLQIPFYNMVIYTIDMMRAYLKSEYQITFNVFLVDWHIRKYENQVEAYRRFIGFVGSLKKYAESDQGQVLTKFLQEGSNDKTTIKLFLRLRKILLKNINQKILQEIKLTHQDAVTIIHTLPMLSLQEKRLLTKKINDFFIAKNVKYLHSTILNGAVLCKILVGALGNGFDQGESKENSISCGYEGNLNKKLASLVKQTTNDPKNSNFSFSEPFSSNPHPSKRNTSIQQELSSDFLTPRQLQELESLYSKENVSARIHTMPTKGGEEEKQSLVSLERCMKELSILKEKDMQIDNRFKKINKNHQE